MSEPQIVAPPPTINQGEDPSVLPSQSPQKDAQIAKSVTAIFDKIMPPPKGETAAPPQTQPPPPSDPTPPTPPPETPPTVPTPKSPDTTRVPTFIEEQLRGTTPNGSEPHPAPMAEDEWPEEPPQFETPEARNSQYKKWRQQYNALKQEARTLRERPASDPEISERVKVLENENKSMAEQLAAVGVEQSAEFQRSVLQPMQQAWQSAAKIVKEAGGDPQALAKALNLTGAAQYAALDEVYSEIPESAKLEAQQAVSAFKHYANQRAQALKDAPRTQAELKKRELQRNYEFIQNQKKEMGVLFDNALAKLRDEAKLEVLQRSNNPDDQWWNEQADNAIALSRELYLENSDLGRMAVVSILAPFADVYRKLWYSAVQRAEKAEGILSQKFGSEPTISESSGNQAVPGAMPTIAEDLKKPFKEVFLREFHKQRAAGVR